MHGMARNENVLSIMADDRLVEEIRTCESEMRALQAKQARFIAESERRGLHTRDGARSPSAWLRRLLNLQDRDACSRVRVASRASPYIDSSGAVVFAELSATVSALGAGELSVAHARVIVDEIDKLPEWVDQRARDDMDAFLAEQAKMLPPRELRVVAVRARHDLDPAVKESEELRQVEQRRLRITTGRDGMTVLKGRLDKETGLKLREVLSRFAGGPDDVDREARSEPQRQADGLALLVDFGLNGEGPRDGSGAEQATPGGSGGVLAVCVKRLDGLPTPPARAARQKSTGAKRPHRMTGSHRRSPLRHRTGSASPSGMLGSAVRSQWSLCRRRPDES